MRSYSTLAFVSQVAAKTRTPVMSINAGGMGASSKRFHDIAMPDEVIAELQENEQAFATFDSEREANAAFDRIVRDFPAAGDTTLSITVILGLPNGRTREFQQIHGYERTFKLAA